MDVEEFATNSVKIYPNPSRGMVFFDNSEGLFDTVRVYNCLAQVVMKPFDCAQGDNSIDFSDLPSGVYMLEFEGDGVRSVARVVKE